ncbi:hypothetical protein L915_08022 [Phytophthora nicotianae]|uniref:Uncharacterized protein n=1 Tax=Phytophthora nicotianae TaxID=4792 RepID=W2GX62_PHYNI|nr:hypothetical protein L915_08022 [Phytophthora nicotianae]
MAMLAQSTVSAIPAFSRKPAKKPKTEHRLLVHTELKKRLSLLDDQNGGFNGFDRLSDGEGHQKAQHEHRRSLLDSLAIDVGEKYLDEIYREDGGDDEDEGSGYDKNQATKLNAQDVKKNLAWQKVRQHLIEEEEKAAIRNHTRSQRASSSLDHSFEEANTVKLLDILASTGEDLYSNSSASDVASNEIQYAPQTLASRIDRMGNKLVQFLQRKINDDEKSDVTRSCVSQASSYEGSRPSRWLLMSLGRVTKTCRRNELSDGAIAQIASHLASIDRIVQEDTTSSGFHHVSNAQRSNESSGYELGDPRNPALYRRSNKAPSIRSSFKAFVSAQDLCETLAAFNNLLADCGLNGVSMKEPWHVYYHVRAAVYNMLGYRQKQLFRILDARFSLNVYKQRPATNKRVCIVGAGPVGLRAGVELALLGGRVSILEKRAKFSRENRLHLWPWVVQDLVSLGAKVLIKNFCKSRTYFHVSTRHLQVILLKVALLVGVKVYSATAFQSIVSPAPENGGSPFYSIKTEPQIPVVEYTAVLGATGINDQVAEPAGISRFVFSQKESLGIVCYFPNLETPEEMKVKEFSWTAKLKHRMLYRMREIGIDLENIVYFRGEMHYLVMTPKRQNLLARGVVKQNCPNSKNLVESTNISQNDLHAFVKRVVEFAGIPRKTDFTRVNLFDFSSLTRADKPASVLTSHDKKLYVGLIGDALLEPVWHEGVGTCRGFLGALDAVWMVAQIGRTSDEQLLADRELAYRVMQRVSGHHRDELQKNVRKYTVEPTSRYIVDFPRAL